MVLTGLEASRPVILSHAIGRAYHQRRDTSDSGSSNPFGPHKDPSDAREGCCGHTFVSLALVLRASPWPGAKRMLADWTFEGLYTLCRGGFCVGVGCRPRMVKLRCSMRPAVVGRCSMVQRGRFVGRTTLPSHRIWQTILRLTMARICI